MTDIGKVKRVHNIPPTRIPIVIPKKKPVEKPINVTTTWPRRAPAPAQRPSVPATKSD